MLISRRAAGGAALAAMLAPALARTARAQQKDKLTIGVVRNSASGPSFIAQAKGYFADQNLEIENVMFDSAGAVTIGVASGSLAAGSVGLAASVLNTAGKGAIVMISGYSKDIPGYHSGAMVASNAAYDAGFHTPKDMKGKRIGLGDFAAATQYEAFKIAQKYGIAFKDLNFQALQSISNMAAAIRGNQIDAIMVGSPTPTALENDHAGHIICWVGEEVPIQFGAIVANTGAVAKEKPALMRFMKAEDRGLADYRQSFLQKDASGKAIRGPNFDGDLKIIADALGVAVPSLGTSLPYVDLNLDAGDIKDQVDFYRNAGYVTGPVDLDKVIDRSFGYVK